LKKRYADRGEEAARQDRSSEKHIFQEILLGVSPNQRKQAHLVELHLINSQHESIKISQMNTIMKEFEWKAVLALNNAAITMMTGSDFRQAADTLKDAMRVLAGSSNEETTFITEKLQKANHCIFNPTESARTKPSKSSIEVLHHDGAVDGTTVDAAILQANTCPNANRYLVIRLESSDVDVMEAHAILFHNYAICWFQGNRNTTAKWLLQESLGILSQLQNDAACPFVIHRTITLMKITGDALAQASEAMQEEEEALYLRTNLLESLYREAQELASSGMFLPTSASPAA
jgi:hypothetical protein